MKKNDFVTQAVLLALVLVLIALVLGSTIITQRERSLTGRLHAWPEADAGYQGFMRFPEEGMPSLSLVTLEEDPGAVYLATTLEDQLYVMDIAPTLLLRGDQPGEERVALAQLRSRGLPDLLADLAGHYALPINHCFRLAGNRVAGLMDRAGMDPLPLDVPAAGTAGDREPDEDSRKKYAGEVLLAYGTLWRQVFTRSGLLSHPGLQADLAVACRVDPDAGYDTLREWGESMRGIAASNIHPLPLPAAGWKEDEQELDGEACRAMLALVYKGEDPSSFLADHEAKKEAERKLHTLTYDPIPPAILDGGNASRMEVAITLDDGYNMDLRILDLLESYAIRCTVFPIGSVAELHPDWLQRMDAHGWEVANHTYTHPITKPTRLIDIPDEMVKAEIVAAQQVIFDAVGKKYPYFRPPGGWVDERVAALAGDLGYVTVLWSLDSGDTRDPQMSPLERADTILDKVKPGYILLFHFGGYHTYETLRYLIPRMQAEGYHFVTLSQLFTP